MRVHDCHIHRVQRMVVGKTLKLYMIKNNRYWHSDSLIMSEDCYTQSNSSNNNIILKLTGLGLGSGINTFMVHL